MIAMELMHHQTEGIDFLLSRSGSLLAFEQGLGKTLVAIEAFRKAHQTGNARRLLVICPNSLKRNWVAELEKFAPGLEATIVEGAPRVRRALFASVNSPVVITSYETARSEVTAIIALLQRARTAMVLDESHAAKNRSSLTSTAARQLSPYAAYRWLLSGTPVTNTPEDLYTQVMILAPDERSLGSLELFVEMAKDPAYSTSLQAKLAPFIMRRTKEQCLDLPDKSFMDIRVELPPWQRELYDEMRDSMVCAIRAMTGEEYKAFASTALAQLTRLAQLATNPSLLFPESTADPGKLVELDALVEDILGDPSRKIIIWSNYTKTIQALVERYKPHGAAAIFGETPVEVRQQYARQFQTEPGMRIIVANPAAAATGFTLTAATYTIYESLSWRYDYYAQSQDRNHRIGQGLPVTYLRLIAVDTIEEAIVSTLERKSAMARALLGDGDDAPPVSSLSREQMCFLLLTNRLPQPG